MILATMPHGTNPVHYSTGEWHMDNLTIFGLVAVSLMLVTYAMERRHPLFLLAFAGACVMGSVYGFLQGAWPFGFVEAVWSVVAFRRWFFTRHTRRTTRTCDRFRRRRLTPPDSDESEAALN